MSFHIYNNIILRDCRGVPINDVYSSVCHIISYIVPLGNGLIKISDGIVWVCACNHVCLFLEDTLNALIGLQKEREELD